MTSDGAAEGLTGQGVERDLDRMPTASRGDVGPRRSVVSTRIIPVSPRARVRLARCGQLAGAEIDRADLTGEGRDHLGLCRVRPAPRPAQPRLI